MGTPGPLGGLVCAMMNEREPLTATATAPERREDPALTVAAAATQGERSTMTDLIQLQDVPLYWLLLPFAAMAALLLVSWVLLFYWGLRRETSEPRRKTRP